MAMVDIWREVVDERLYDSHELFKWVSDYRKALLDSSFFYPDFDYPAIFMQKWRGKYDIYDAFGFARIDSEIVGGKISWFGVNVGIEPIADKKMPEMELALRNILPPEIQIDLWGGTDGDGDGQIILPESTTTKNSGWYPLEIGYTQIHTTIWHLTQCLRLARWPYGSKVIYFFHCEENSSFLMKEIYDSEAILNKLSESVLNENKVTP